MATPSTRPAVLVVDDEIGNLQTFRRVFRNDFDIVMASSGAEALDKLRERDFDVALLDFAMPDMNGLELLSAAVQLRPHLAFVFVTAHAEIREIREARERALVAGVIMKPWEKENIVRWVNQGYQLSATRRAVANLKQS